MVSLGGPRRPGKRPAPHLRPSPPAGPSRPAAELTLRVDALNNLLSLSACVPVSPAELRVRELHTNRAWALAEVPAASPTALLTSGPDLARGGRDGGDARRAWLSLCDVTTGARRRDSPTPRGLSFPCEIGFSLSPTTLPSASAHNELAQGQKAGSPVPHTPRACAGPWGRDACRSGRVEASVRPHSHQPL